MTKLKRTDQTAALSTDLATITAEINAYKRVAGEAIFEIGRRLKHVKENDLAHGEFGKWLESVEIDWNVANRIMKVVEELSSNSDTYHNLGMNALYLIATLPPEERGREHTLESGETKRPDEMTVRELRELKKALKEAEKQRDEALKSAAESAETNHTLMDTLASLRDQPPKVEYVPDPDVAEKLRRYEQIYGDIDETGVYRIDNSEEVNGAALQFSEDVRGLLARYSHLTMYETEFLAINKYSAQEYKSTIEALKEFITAMERNLAYKTAEEAVIIDISH